MSRDAISARSALNVVIPAIRLIVFDLDGTLVDSLRDLAESANALLVECGGEPQGEEAIGRMVGDGAATLVARAFTAARLVRPPDALGRFLAIYNSRLLKFTRPYPGIDEVLTELGRRVKLAVLTNKPLQATRQILEGLDLARHFLPDRVLGGDGPFPRKPEPAALQWLAAVESVDLGETLLVGDSAIDWHTARAASARACLASYGFGYNNFPTQELRQEDLVIDRPSGLLAAL